MRPRLYQALCWKAPRFLPTWANPKSKSASANGVGYDPLECIRQRWRSDAVLEPSILSHCALPGDSLGTGN